jgi:hypothetical protein
MFDQTHLNWIGDVFSKKKKKTPSTAPKTIPMMATTAKSQGGVGEPDSVPVIPVVVGKVTVVELVVVIVIVGQSVFCVPLRIKRAC